MLKSSSDMGEAGNDR